MNDIQKKTYIDKDETDSMEKNKQMKKKTNCVHIQCTLSTFIQISTCLTQTAYKSFLVKHKLSSNRITCVQIILNLSIVWCKGAVEEWTRVVDLFSFITDSVAGACNESSWKWILLRNSLQMYRNIAYFTSHICYKPQTVVVDCNALSCVLDCCVCS